MERSLAYLRERYPLVDVVERWNPYARKRKDLWGIADLVALGDNTILAVQTTSASHVSDHIKKIEDSPNLPILRKAGIEIHVHGWGKKKGKWTLRDVDLS